MLGWMPVQGLGWMPSPKSCLGTFVQTYLRARARGTRLAAPAARWTKSGRADAHVVRSGVV